MSEQSTDPDIQAAELADKSLNWQVSSDEINAMTHEELREEAVLINEKIRRLYAVAMLDIEDQKLGEQVKPEDIDHILNPEKFE